MWLTLCVRRIRDVVWLTLCRRCYIRGNVQDTSLKLRRANQLPLVRRSEQGHPHPYRRSVVAKERGWGGEKMKKKKIKKGGGAAKLWCKRGHANGNKHRHTCAHACACISSTQTLAATATLPPPLLPPQPGESLPPPIHLLSRLHLRCSSSARRAAAACRSLRLGGRTGSGPLEWQSSGQYPFHSSSKCRRG